MLPARTILPRRIVSLPYRTTWARCNSTRPTGPPEQDALSQEKQRENPSAAEGTIPLSAPPPTTHKPQEPLVPESTSATASSHSPSSSSGSTLKNDSGSDKPDSWKELSQYDLEVVKQRIREWTEQAAIVLRERADGFTNETKTKFARLGAELNKVTGYEEIEALKREVVQQGLFF